jgi:hypothetical protein
VAAPLDATQHRLLQQEINSMKIAHKMTVTRAALYVCIVAGLTACGHSIPSERDAKAAVEARLADCKYFKVSSFEKINGIPMDDNDYQVEVKYTITMSPTDTNKAQVQTWKADDAKYQDLEAQLKTVAAADAFSEQAKALSGDAYVVQQRALRESSPLSLAQNVVQECPNISRWALNQFFAGRTKVTAYSDDINYTLTETIPMEKTDNGWQEAR